VTEGVALGTDVVKAVHLGIASVPFSVLEAIPVTRGVTSSIVVVTKTREPGPAGSSSSFVFARKPLVMRSRCGVELNCSAPKPQWWKPNFAIASRALAAGAPR